MNRLFVVNKPIFRSSNGYMRYVKKKYNTKKVGYSGTLDPFATGCLIVATGQYTKLFNYIKKTPKKYKATLWLGATSPMFDIEKVDSIVETPEFNKDLIQQIISSFQGLLTYYPPKYCAKKINGVRAYDLARENKEVNLKQITSMIYSIKLLNYSHPFIHFEAEVSEGTYIRSLGQLISDKLEVNGTLSSLQRVYEGKFIFDNEKALNPLDYLKIPQNYCIKDEVDIELGRKISVDYFQIQDDGIYFIVTTNFFCIIEIIDSKVKYKLNRIEKFVDDIR